MLGLKLIRVSERVHWDQSHNRDVLHLDADLSALFYPKGGYRQYMAEYLKGTWLRPSELAFIISYLR